MSGSLQYLELQKMNVQTEVTWIYDASIPMSIFSVSTTVLYWYDKWPMSTTVELYRSEGSLLYAFWGLRRTHSSPRSSSNLPPVTAAILY